MTKKVERKQDESRIVTTFSEEYTKYINYGSLIGVGATNLEQPRCQNREAHSISFPKILINTCILRERKTWRAMTV